MKYDKCPNCGSEIWLVEYPLTDPNHYDGTSEYACKNAINPAIEGDPVLAVRSEHLICDWRVGRFCGRKLAVSECERPYCTGESHLLKAEEPKQIR